MNTFLLALQLLVADTSKIPFPYTLHSAKKEIDWKNMKYRFRRNIVTRLSTHLR